MDRVQELVNLANSSVLAAEKGQCKIKPDGWRLLELFGESSDRIKFLLNNLLELSDAAYLELGVYRGASLISAMYKNKHAKAYGIDNFAYSPFEKEPYKKKVLTVIDPTTKTEKKIPNPEPYWPNVKKAWEEHRNKFAADANITFIQKDFLNVKMEELKIPFNIIFLDALKSSSSTEIETILTHYSASFSKQFILVVGSWMQDTIQKALHNWIKKNKYVQHAEIIKRSGSFADKDGWYAGVGIFVLEKAGTTK